jgi:transcriptional regulator with XRE-family HTH domain
MGVIPQGGHHLPLTPNDLARLRKVDGPALRQLRLKARLSQPQLSALCDGVHTVSISRLESGVRERCQEITALRLADGLSKALDRAVKADEFSSLLEPESVELAS